MAAAPTALFPRTHKPMWKDGLCGTREEIGRAQTHHFAQDNPRHLASLTTQNQQQ